MGAVYEAEHELLHKRVAVKVMSGRLVDETAAAERFLSEMKALGKLNHPNLVRGLDARREGGRLYLIMEFLDAEDLQSYRQREGSLPLQRVCDIIRQAALGLAHAHEQGIIHRDIKPSNLMLTGDGIVKVLDLGLARLESEQHDERLTSDKMIVGTPDYISPEQIQTPRDVDARADIYGLGCTMFYLLTGRSPFQEHAAAMPKMMAHVNQQSELPAEVLQALPESLVRTLSKLMEKDRDKRFQTTRDVVEALSPFCEPSEADAGNRTTQPVPTQSLRDKPPGRKPLKEKAKPVHAGEVRSNSRRIWILGAIPLALVVALGFSLLIKTEAGTIELKFENSSQLATVDIRDNGTIKIKDPTDNQPITITVDRKKRKLRLSKVGFEVLTKDFQLDVNGQKIDVTFTPVKREPPKINVASGAAATPSKSDAAGKEGPETPVVQNGVAISHRGGEWVIDGDEIVQTQVGRKGRYLTFGDPTWSEYDFSFEGWVPNGESTRGFHAMYHFKSEGNVLWFGVGAYSNKWHEATRVLEGKWSRRPDMITRGSIQPETWHKVRIKVRGATARCYLDDQLIFVHEEPLFESGQCGLATYDTRARFRKVRVVRPDGKVLWDGVPSSIQEVE